MGVQIRFHRLLNAMQFVIELISDFELFVPCSENVVNMCDWANLITIFANHFYVCVCIHEMDGAVCYPNPMLRREI